MRYPKALLEIGNETFAACIARKAREAGIQSIFLITGPDHEAIVKHSAPEIVCIRNDDFRKGQISSLQKGIRSLTADTDAVMVWPVDQPLIQSDTARRLIDSYERESRELTIPIYQQRKGHPVIYGKQAMQSALGLGSQQTAKQLQSMYSNNLVLMEVEDPAILIDIDTPGDYAKYIRT